MDFSTLPPSADCCLNPGVRLPCHLGDLCAPKPYLQACRWMEGIHVLAQNLAASHGSGNHGWKSCGRSPLAYGKWMAAVELCRAGPQVPPLPGRAGAMASRA